MHRGFSVHRGVSVWGSLSRGSLCLGGLCHGDAPIMMEERAVCILLECILVVHAIVEMMFGSQQQTRRLLVEDELLM